MSRFSALLFAAALPLLPAISSAADPALESALARAGSNRAALEEALARVPPEQAGSLRFLIEHMPERDLRNLDAAFLLEHVASAHAALAAAPWRSSTEA